MVESEKEANTVAPKAKKSLIDDEFGKDFLSPWKSMSVTEDDAMDFSFDNAEKWKQKKFNFDKVDMDMDFNLGGDFGKFDMPDLDFSCAPKKTAKTKEGSAEESSCGNRQGKGEPFSFSFDFNNEMDNFDFDSSLTREKAPKKDLKGERVAFVNVGNQSSKKDQSEDENKLLQASKSTALPYIDNSVTCDGDLTSARKDSVGESTDSEMAVQQNEECLYVTKSPSEKENDQQVHLSEEDASRIPHVERREGGISKSDCKLRSNALYAANTGDGTSLIEQNICDKMVEEETSSCRNLQSLDPPALSTSISENDSRDKSLFDVAASKHSTDSIRCAQGDSKLGDKPTHCITGEKQSNGTVNENGENSGEKIALALLNREPISEVTPINGIESGSVHSKFLKRLGDTGDRPQLLPSMVMKPTQLEAKRVVAVNQNPIEETRERSTAKDIEHGGMVISNLCTTSGDPTGALESVESQNASKATKVGGQSGDKKLIERLKIVEDASKIGDQTRVPLLVDRKTIINDASKIGDQTKGEKLVQSLKVNEDASIVGDQTRVPKLPERQKINENVSTIRDQIRAPRLVQSQIIQNASKIRDQTRVPTLASQKIIDRASKVGLLLNSSNLVKKSNGSNDQACENPQPVNSSSGTLGNSKIASLGENKLKPIKASKTASNMPVLSISRISARNKERLGPRPLPGSSSTSSSSQRKEEWQTNSMEKILSHGSSNVEKQISKNSTDKQVLLTPSLKRKTHETSDTNLLSPFKRLSSSPSETRISKESAHSEERREVVAYRPDKRVDIRTNKNASSGNLQTEISNEMKRMAQLEISSVKENDGTVEKAEAYTKELEDMCNMLKKKQEEAKEVLLRAIVNNNNLLMLNHPMFEHKMRKVQKLASQLMGKEEEVRVCMD